MRISKAEYNELIESREVLEREVKRLADLITEKTENCCMGGWCRDCIHLGTDYSTATYNGILEVRTNQYGRVRYCKKHLHEVCPEFEMKG